MPAQRMPREIARKHLNAYMWDKSKQGSKGRRRLDRGEVKYIVLQEGSFVFSIMQGKNTSVGKSFKCSQGW